MKWTNGTNSKMQILFTESQIKKAMNRIVLSKIEYELAVVWLESNYKEVSMITICDIISRCKCMEVPDKTMSEWIINEYISEIGMPDFCPIYSMCV